MKYEINEFNIDVKGNTFKCRPWTSREERSFLSVKNGNTKLANVAKLLIFPNMEFKPMTLSEFEYLMLRHRILSVGDEVELNVTCSCGQRLEFEKPINDLIHFSAPKLDKQTISSEDIEVELRRIPSKELLLKVLEVDDEDERTYIEFLASIASITYKGETNSTFVFEDLEEFFDSLPSSIFRSLLGQFYSLKGHLQLFTEVSCVLCGNKFDAVFKDIQSFL